MVDAARDIFDELDVPDIFDEIDKPDVFDETEDVQAIIDTALSKFKPQVIQKMIHLPAPAPQKVKEIVKETIIREVEKKGSYADEKEVAKLKKQIEELKALVEEQGKIFQFLGMIGGSGVIGIPNPEGQNGKVLGVINNQPKWQVGGTGGASSDAYTVSGLNTNRTLTATSTIDTLYEVVASLIQSLQGAGIIQ